jgi:hypothetical protein
MQKHSGYLCGESNFVVAPLEAKVHEAALELR